MKLLDDRLLVEPIIEEEKTPGGIIIPESAKQHQVGKAKVLEAGDKGKSFSLTVKEGDTILYDKSRTIPWDDNKLIRQSDVIFIL
jgi:chaperonin GroES